MQSLVEFCDQKMWSLDHDHFVDFSSIAAGSLEPHLQEKLKTMDDAPSRVFYNKGLW